MRRILVVVSALLIAIATSAAGWPTDHGDNQRTGDTSSTSAWHRFGTAYTLRLDGAVYGSPIMAGPYVIVATENNTVYAFDPATGGIRWTRHLRSPISDTSVLACSGNIKPTGITSTPAYDASTGRVFVVSVTYNRSVGVEHEIWGLNAGNGKTLMNRRVEVPGTDPKAEQQRSALAVDRGNVYIGFGGLAGDCGKYKGAIVALKTNGAVGGVSYVVPTTREGAIWAAGGPVVAPDGNLYVAVGNGESTSAFDYTDSVTKISPAMRRLDYFAPSSWAFDNANDLDLGSMTPAYNATTGYILQAGKSGEGYTVRIAHLGGVGGQVYKAALCRAFGVSAVIGNTVYLPCTDGVKKVRINTNGTFSILWSHAGVPGSPVAGPGALYTLGGTRLYALTGANGSTLGSVDVGTTTRFATPMLSGNKVFVGTTTGIVAKTIA